MKSKRLLLSFFTLCGNFFLFYVGIKADMKGNDLVQLGVGLATISLPVMGYIFGETYRPSGAMHATQKPTV
jgi:hypothetical protein